MKPSVMSEKSRVLTAEKSKVRTKFLRNKTERTEHEHKTERKRDRVREDTLLTGTSPKARH